MAACEFPHSNDEIKDYFFSKEKYSGWSLTIQGNSPTSASVPPIIFQAIPVSGTNNEYASQADFLSKWKNCRLGIYFRMNHFVCGQVNWITGFSFTSLAIPCICGWINWVVISWSSVCWLIIVAVSCKDEKNNKKSELVTEQFECWNKIYTKRMTVTFMTFHRHHNVCANIERAYNI